MIADSGLVGFAAAGPDEVGVVVRVDIDAVGDVEVVTTVVPIVVMDAIVVVRATVVVTGTET